MSLAGSCSCGAVRYDSAKLWPEESLKRRKAVLGKPNCHGPPSAGHPGGQN